MKFMRYFPYTWLKRSFGHFFFHSLVIFLGLMSCQKDESEPNIEPVSPKNLSFEQLKDGLQLSWNVIIDTSIDNIPDRYQVYRLVHEPDGKQYEKKIADTDQLYLLDTDVVPNRTYIYSVSGIKNYESGNLESVRSERIQAIFATGIADIDVDFIDFSETENQRTVTIRNIGKADLHWSTTIDGDWVKTTPSTGTVAAESEIIVLLTADRRQTPGRLGAILMVQTFEQAVPDPVVEPTFVKKIDITLNIPPKPVLTVIPNSVDFGLNRQYRMVKVLNTGSGRLDWEAKKTKRSDWLYISPTSGSIMAGEVELVKLEIDEDELADFPVGFQINETVRIERINNQDLDLVQPLNSEDLRSLFITVKIPEPRLSLSAKIINFGEDKNRLPLIIDNVGTGQFGWQISGGADWLHYTPKTGLTDIDLDRVELVIDRHQLPIDDYTSEVMIRTQGPAGYNDQQTVKIRMSVGEEPEISLSTNHFDFGSSQQTSDFTITNIGTGRLVWNIENKQPKSESPNWLTFSPTSGHLRRENMVIQMNVDRTNLAAGEYESKIIVKAEKAETKQVSVKMSVPRSELQLSTTMADFGIGTTVDLERSSQSIKFNNHGQAVVDWGLSSSARWIGLRYQQKVVGRQSLTGTLLSSTSDEVEIFIQKIDELPTGQHQSEIEISDGSRLQTIQVRFSKVGEVSGTVIDLETEQILAPVQLQLRSIDNQQVVNLTSAVGRFQLPFSQDGRYEISVQAETHIPRTETVITRLGQAKIHVRLSPFLNRSSSIRNGLHSPNKMTIDSQNRLYVSNQISGTITVLDNLTQTSELVLNQPDICQPSGLAVWRNQLLVSLSATDQIAVIDTQSQQEIHRFAIGDYPDHCQIVGNRMYVALRRENKIAVVDLTIPARKYRIPVAREPGPMVADINQLYLYVCNTSDDTVSVIDLQAERELYRIRVGQKPKQIALGNKLNNGQKYLYVVNSLSGDVSVIQTENRLEVNRINTGRRSAVVAIQPLSLGREILYIIDRGGIVSAVEMPRQTMVRDIGLNLPQGPSSGNYNPKTNQIYVLHRTSQQLSVLYAD